jgi:hypothetical protein
MRHDADYPGNTDDAASVAEDSPEGSPEDFPAEAPEPAAPETAQPLIFAALVVEYDGLPTPAGTEWGLPAMPPKGVARVAEIPLSQV